jgi:hypothetical protein
MADPDKEHPGLPSFAKASAGRRGEKQRRYTVEKFV